MLLQLVVAALRSPWNLLFRRYRLFMDVFRRHWGLGVLFGDLAPRPVFHLNATPLQTGKRWAFTQAKMGDYVFGYADSATVPVALAVTASSGFPFLIGGVSFDTRPFNWRDGPYGRGLSSEERNKHRRVLLWDGGVYENTGLEPFFKNGALRKGLDFLIVADAAEPFQTQASAFWLSAPLRLLFIAMEQVRSLRARQVVQMFRAGSNGFYAKIGKSPWEHLEELKVAVVPWFPRPLSSYTARVCSAYRMGPHQVPKGAFDKMTTHGWQTCETIYGALFEQGNRVPASYARDPVGIAATE